LGDLQHVQPTKAPVYNPFHNLMNQSKQYQYGSSEVFANDRDKNKSFGPEKYAKIGKALPRLPPNHDGKVYGLVDTGALIPMGGNKSLQGLHLVSAGVTVQDSDIVTRGIEPTAVVKSEALTEFQVSVAGCPLQLGFEWTKGKYSFVDCTLPTRRTWSSD
jgi:hypothetical protein